MAFTAAVEWDVRTTGSDSNGGGFAVGSGGTDYSQQDSPQVTYTDLVIDGTTNTDCTSAAFPFTSAHVGNIINITSGTGFTVQRVQIISIQGANTARVDKSLGTLSSTGGNGRLGGALLSPALPCGLTVGSNIVWIKSGTYNVTVNTANVTSGKLAPAGSPTAAGGPTGIIGYGTTHGDMGTPPLIQSNGSITGSLIALTTGEWVINVNLDGGGAGALAGISGGGLSYRCSVSNCVGTGIAGSVLVCHVSGCTTGIDSSSALMPVYGCVARNCTGIGFTLGDAGISYCLSVNNGSHGFSSSPAVGASAVSNCAAYGNTGDGFRINAATNFTTLENCIGTGNTGWQFAGSSTTGMYLMLNCAFKADGSGSVNTNLTNPTLFPKQINCITLTASPFTNAAGGDFSLNGTAGGGAELKAAGVVGVLPGASTINTTGYQDIGVAQHATSSGSSIDFNSFLYPNAIVGSIQ